MKYQIMMTLNFSLHTSFIYSKTPLFRCTEKLNHNILYMSSKKCIFLNSLILMGFCCDYPVDEMWIKTGYQSTFSADIICLAYAGSKNSEKTIRRLEELR